MQSPITFEASIHYYHHKVALENMHAILPCSRIIWILRNPLPRAFSEYLHQAVKKKRYPSFASILEDEIRTIQACAKRIREPGFDQGFENPLFKCLAEFKLTKYTLSTGFYAYFIHAWSTKFPLEQHLFLDYDRFRASPEVTLNEISDFLGIASFPRLSPRWNYNKANTRDGVAKSLRERNMKLHSKLKKKIERILQPHVLKVYEYARKNFEWKLDSLA